MNPFAVSITNTNHPEAFTEAKQKPMLAENAAEAERMTYAGRSTAALQSARTFDETRFEASPLFSNAKRQGGLF